MFQGFQKYQDFANSDLTFGFEGEPDLFYRSVDLHLSTVHEDIENTFNNCVNEALELSYEQENMYLDDQPVCQKTTEQLAGSSKHLSLNSSNIFTNYQDHIVLNGSNVSSDCTRPKIDATYLDKSQLIEQTQQELQASEIKNYQLHNSSQFNPCNDLPLCKWPIRKDLCYKNVFRATKKYYLSLFKLHSEFFKTTSKSERKKIANSELNSFVQSYFIEKDESNLLNGLTKEDLVHLVGRIVIPEYMTKESNLYLYRKECELLHDCIYRFNSKYANKFYQSKYRENS